MALTKVPIDGERNALLAWPIPEVGDLRFVELIRRYSDALGSSGYVRIAWVPLDDPRRTDAAYEKLRDDEFNAPMKMATIEYDRDIANRGGADHHLSREYTVLASRLGVRDADRPCIVVGSRPHLGFDIVFRVPTRLLSTRECQNALGDFLVATFSKDLVTSALNRHGFLDDKSWQKLGDSIRKAESELQSLEVIAPSSQPLHPQCTALVVTRDERRYMTKDELESLLDGRSTYDLIVDVPRCRVLYHRSHRPIEVHVYDRAIRLVAAVMAAEQPISIEELIAEHDHDCVRNAYNSFCEGRRLVQEAMQRETRLFRTVRTGFRGNGRYEFTPRKDLKWALLLPPDGLKLN